MRKYILILMTIFSLLFVFGCNNSVAPEESSPAPSETPTEKPEDKPEQLPEGTPSDKPVAPPEDPGSNLILTSNVPYDFLAPEHSITLTLSTKKKTDAEAQPNIKWTNSNEQAVAVVKSDDNSITIKGKAIGISTITAKDKNTGHKVSYTAEVRDAEIIVVDNNTRVDIPDLIQLEKETSSQKYQLKTRILYWDAEANEIRQFVRPDIFSTVQNLNNEFFTADIENIEQNGITNQYITFKATSKNTFDNNNKNGIQVYFSTEDLGNKFQAISKTITLESYGDRENTEFSIKEVKIDGQPVSGTNVNLPNNKKVSLEVVIQKKNALTMYDFDKSSIATETGADADGKVKEYSGKKVVSGKEVLGLPYYNHKGTDWIQYKEKQNTEKEDTWIFNISPNLTSRNRKVTLPFNGGNKKFEVSIYQPRSYDQHETVIWFAGVEPPPANAYTKEGNIPDYYVNEQKGSFDISKQDNNFTGWFNVNKIMGSAGLSGNDLAIYKDGSMCWAMAASNLIHWWANQNKDNLQKLIELKNDSEGKELSLYDFSYDYDPDSQEFDKTELGWQKQRKAKSKVGDTVRRVFIDSPTGGDPVIIFNWYFENLSPTYKDFFEDNFKDTKYANGLGLLSEIPDFNGIAIDGKRSHIYTAEGAGNREETNRFFNDVIKNGKAAMYLYKFGSEKNKHYVTAWAAIYDDYGDVVGIYTADNNMPGQLYFDGAPSNSYMFRRRIAYRDDNSRALIIDPATPFNEKTIQYATNEFNLLYSISSGKEQIAEYIKSKS